MRNKRHCDGCGKISTVENMHPQKILLDMPAIWVCNDCVNRSDSRYEIYDRYVRSGSAPAAKALASHRLATTHVVSQIP